MTAIDLGNVHLIVDRPGATPAPTAGPGDQPGVPSGPWHPQHVPGYVDTTPANLGLDNDLVAHAIHALNQFGTNTRREAKVLLSMWARRDELTADQVAEVLAYYPALKAVA